MECHIIFEIHFSLFFSIDSSEEMWLEKKLRKFSTIDIES